MFSLTWDLKQTENLVLCSDVTSKNTKLYLNIGN